MHVARWIIGGLLLAFSLYVAIAQVVGVVTAIRRQRVDPEAGGYSIAPLLGGVVGALGALAIPSATVQRLWWVPLIVDPGCDFLFGWTAVWGIGQLLGRLIGPRS